MNKFIKHFNKQIKTFNIYDLKLLSWASLMLGLLLAIVFPALMQIHPIWYVCIIILLILKPYIKLLKK